MLKKTLYTVSRLLVGAVFLFSSFVKGVDPMGTAYKIEDYLNAWSIAGIGFQWAVPMAVYLSMALIVLEFVVGVALVCNCFKKLTPWVLTLMMAFFTVTTFVDALTNKVEDCGCFGDAVKLTNWQTFWKNVALDVLVVVIWITRPRKTKFRTETDVIIGLFAIVIMLIFGIYNIKNEPCIDFRPWKVGNQMIPNIDKEMQSFVQYKNNQTGNFITYENKEFMAFVSEKYATEDGAVDWTRFNAEWTFDTSWVEQPEVTAGGFCMIDSEGEDYTMDLIGGEDYVLIATIHNLAEVDEDGLKAMKYMKRFADENGMQAVVLTAALVEEMQAYMYENDLTDMDFYWTDDTAIKTMLRSNPGFILIKHGVVVGKWHYRNYLKINEIEL